MEHIKLFTDLSEKAQNFVSVQVAIDLQELLLVYPVGVFRKRVRIRLKSKKVELPEGTKLNLESSVDKFLAHAPKGVIVCTQILRDAVASYNKCNSSRFKITRSSRPKRGSFGIFEDYLILAYKKGDLTINELFNLMVIDFLINYDEDSFFNIFMSYTIGVTSETNIFNYTRQTCEDY